ncbi:hypothetical protein BH10PSE12_BH10PSE12_18880 [soil metagenome]
MSVTDFIALLGRTSQEDCRELGQILMDLAEAPRDTRWKATVREVASRFQTPQQQGLADRLGSSRHRFIEAHDKLRALGLDHRALITAELVRRGSAQTSADIEREIGMSSNIQQPWVENNVDDGLS